MPSQDVPAPNATGAIDRMTLVASAVRGASPQFSPLGAYGLCFDAAPSSPSPFTVWTCFSE
jgi:hypothetical protein